MDPVTWAIISLILTAASTAYQIYQSNIARKKAKQAKKDAEAASDARKGFEIVVEGTATTLPIVYGNAKIGGARVFHAVSGNFFYDSIADTDPTKVDKTIGVYKNRTSESCPDIVLEGDPEYPLSRITIDVVKIEVSGTWVCGYPYNSDEERSAFDRFKEEQPDAYKNLSISNNTVSYQGKTYLIGALTTDYINDGLSRTITGTKNEFLYFQQALCQGPISGVYDVIIDDSRYLDDPELGDETEIEKTDKGKNKQVKKEAAIRIDCHYGYPQGQADVLMGLNHYERKDSKFKNIAYTSVIIRLDRDYPQFTTIPNLQFLIQGKQLPYFTSPTTLATDGTNYLRKYSNNPALCMLDYLLDSIVGNGLSENELDLESFYNASIICDTIVSSNDPPTKIRVGGKLYNPTNTKDKDPSLPENAKLWPILPTDGFVQRFLRLYECNLIIDPQKTVRENIEEILSTMGDARLVWSQGKYKINMQYPRTNEDIDFATIITDDDLILDQEIELSFPTASDRLNHCIIKYHNETENFEEAMVAWPPKQMGKYWSGIGGFRYPTVGDFDSDKPCGQFLNTYGVWSSNPDYLGTTSANMTWAIRVAEGGAYKITVAWADKMQLFIGTNNTGRGYYNTPVLWEDGGCNTDESRTADFDVSFSADTTYWINIEAFVGPANNRRGAAAMIWKPLSGGNTASKQVLWKTTDPAYADFIEHEVTEKALQVYLDMLAEDSGVELETEITAQGITDYYHALAKAEEMVRSSRSTAVYKFKCVLKDKYIEPGDFVLLSTKELQNEGVPGPLEVPLRINEIKINEDYTYDIIGDRFDYTQLAWNVDDDEYEYPSPIYKPGLPAPGWIKFVPQLNLEANTIGYLVWGPVVSPILASYVLYYNVNFLKDTANQFVFNWLGESPATMSQGTIEVPINKFTVKYIEGENLNFGIRSKSKTGKLSWMTTTMDGGGPGGPPPPVKPLPPIQVGECTKLLAPPRTLKFKFKVPAFRDVANTLPYTNHKGVRIYVGSNVPAGTTDFANFYSFHAYIDKDAVDAGQELEVTYTMPALDTAYSFVAKCITTQDVESDFSARFIPDIKFVSTDPIDPICGFPPIPTNFAGSGGMNSMYFSHDPYPFYNVVGTRLYGYVWDLLTNPIEGVDEPVNQNDDPHIEWEFDDIAAAADAEPEKYIWAYEEGPKAWTGKTFYGLSFQPPTYEPRARRGKFWITWWKNSICDGHNPEKVESHYYNETSDTWVRWGAGPITITTDFNPYDLIDIITGLITEHQLYRSLQERIGLIEGLWNFTQTYPVYIEETLKIYVTEDEVSVIAQSIIQASLVPGGDIYATIFNSESVLVNAIGAWAESVTLLQSNFEDAEALARILIKTTAMKEWLSSEIEMQVQVKMGSNLLCDTLLQTEPNYGVWRGRHLRPAIGILKECSSDKAAVQLSDTLEPPDGQIRGEYVRETKLSIDLAGTDYLELHQDFPVTGNKYYEFYVYVIPNGGNAVVFLAWFDKKGKFIESSPWTSTTMTSTAPGGSGASILHYQRIGGFTTSPKDAVTGSFILRPDSGSGNAAATVRYTRPLFSKARPGQDKHSDWKSYSEDEYSSIMRQRMQVTADMNNGDLYGEYTLKIDQGGFLSGFGLSSLKNTKTGLRYSEFGVSADTFYMVGSVFSSTAYEPTGGTFWTEGVAPSYPVEEFDNMFYQYSETKADYNDEVPIYKQFNVRKAAETFYGDPGTVWKNIAPVHRDLQPIHYYAGYNGGLGKQDLDCYVFSKYLGLDAQPYRYYATQPGNLWAENVAPYKLYVYTSVTEADVPNTLQNVARISNSSPKYTGEETENFYFGEMFWRHVGNDDEEDKTTDFQGSGQPAKIMAQAYIDYYEAHTTWAYNRSRMSAKFKWRRITTDSNWKPIRISPFIVKTKAETHVVGRRKDGTDITVQTPAGVYMDTATIGYASISSAHIGSATINNAHIIDAEIDNLKIGPSAISAVVSWYEGDWGGGRVYIPLGYYQDFRWSPSPLTVPMPASGSSGVTLFGSANCQPNGPAGTVALQILRAYNMSLVGSGSAYSIPAGFSNNLLVTETDASPILELSYGVGGDTHLARYILRVSAVVKNPGYDPPGIYVQTRSLIAIGHKR